MARTDTQVARAAAAMLGARGGRASALKLTPGQRSEKASRAARARWGKVRSASAEPVSRRDSGT